ncbi:short transient receptor potential channel 4-like, partial [Saccoglossus kowalevskii]
AFFALRSLKPVVAVDGADIPNNDVDNDVSFYPTIDSSGYDGIVDIDAMHDDEEEILPAYQPAWIREYDPTGDLDLENLVLIFKDAAECQDSFQQNLTVFLQGKLILVQSVMEELTRYRNEAAKAETHTRNRRAARRINKGGASSGSAGGADEEEEALSNYPRYQLAATDPILVAESLFALAKVFSFLRVTRITVVHMQVGPMQISLGRMMFDICRFLTIFSFVWFAFSIGLNQLYFVHSYEKKLNCHLSGTTDALCPVPYGSVVDSLTTLFWALFGMAELSTLDIRGADHWFTENIGRLLFAAYNVVAIVVLLNVLIAMMSNTYTRIEEDADMQWKFSRSSLWMSFYDESNTLSPPFNYIPTWRSFRFIMKNLKGKFNGEKQERKRKKQSIFAKKEQEYKDVIHQLVQRYIFDKRRSGEDEEGGDPLLMQLKEDISGFKYDMFEALTDMDSKMRQLKSQIDQKQAEPVRQDPPHMIGSEMLQAMHDAVAPKPKSPQPIGPETFQHWGSIHLIDETSDILEEEEEGNEEYVDSEQESLVHSMYSIKIE